MKNNEFYKTRMRLMLLLSPVIFVIAFWGVMEIFQHAGATVTKKGKYIVFFITLFSYYFAIFQSIKKYFFEMHLILFGEARVPMGSGAPPEGQFSPFTLFSFGAHIAPLMFDSLRSFSRDLSPA